MTLHDLLTLLILPNRNIGVQYIRYTSEYISKLQIHQHSLLTRKVFSLTKFISTILLLWIIIKAGSSLDQHQVWIITRSTSSPDPRWINIKARSSSKLDHHQIIINIIASAISNKWCYLSILLVTRSSTDPTLFHASCRPILHVGIHDLQHLYLTME